MSILQKQDNMLNGFLAFFERVLLLRLVAGVFEELCTVFNSFLSPYQSFLFLHRGRLYGYRLGKCIISRSDTRRCFDCQLRLKTVTTNRRY
jgi:hypothetical protein